MEIYKVYQDTGNIFSFNKPAEGIVNILNIKLPLGWKVVENEAGQKGLEDKKGNISWQLMNKKEDKSKRYPI